MSYSTELTLPLCSCSVKKGGGLLSDFLALYSLPLILSGPFFALPLFLFFSCSVFESSVYGFSLVRDPLLEGKLEGPALPEDPSYPPITEVSKTQF